MHQFANQEEAMKVLKKAIVMNTGSTVAEEIQAKIGHIIEAIPATVRESLDPDDTIAAAQYAETYFATLNKNAAPAGNAVATQAGAAPKAAKKSGDFALPSISTEAQKAAMEIITANFAQRLENTKATSILKLVVENPKQSERFKGLNFVPKAYDAAKWEEWEKALVPGDDNRKAFEELKEAAGKKSMEIYINDDNRKVIGARIELPSGEAGKSSAAAPVLLRADKLIGVMTTKTAGRIPSEKTGIGATLSQVRPSSKGSQLDVTSQMFKPNVKWTGKKEALADEKKVEVANQAKKEGGKTVTGKVPVKSEKFFTVYLGDETNLDSKGNRKTRKVRLTGEVEAVQYVRASEEYTKEFGPVAVKGVVSADLSDKEKDEARRLTFDLIRAASNNQLAGVDGLGEEFKQALSNIKQAEQTGTAKAVAGLGLE